MIPESRALVAEPSTWLAVLICCGLCALAWFGYRATDQWQRSAALLADHRGQEAADLLTRALTRDMTGVQTSILNSPEQDRHAFDPPYEANDLVALAFARFPYPEFFFGWTPSSGGTVMFARTDRLPVWLTSHERADVYPVEVRRDPPQIVSLRQRVESDLAARRRYSVFDMAIGGVRYQVVALLSYEGATENRSTVCSASPSISNGRASTISRTSSGRLLKSPGARAPPRLPCSMKRTPRRRHARAGLASNRGHAGLSGSVFRSDARRGGTPARSRRSDHGRSRPALPAIPHSSWPRAARSGASSSSSRVSRSWHSASSPRHEPRRASAAVATVRADFVATVTHELKTPLSTIRAVGETIARGRVKTDQDLKRYAGLLVREERRLTRLVNNLLAYSRVTDVTEVYSFESHDPAVLIEEATHGFRRQLADGDSTWR